MKYKSLTELARLAKVTPFQLNWDALENPKMAQELIHAAELAYNDIMSLELLYLKLIHDEVVFEYDMIVKKYNHMAEENREPNANRIEAELLDRYRTMIAAKTFVEITETLTNA